MNSYLCALILTVMAVEAAPATQVTSAPSVTSTTMTTPATDKKHLIFTDCGNNNTLQVTLSTGRSRCILTSGTIVYIVATFNATLNTSYAYIEIWVTFNGILVLLPSLRPNVCTALPEQIKPKCPIVANNQYHYNSTFTVEPFFPPGNYTVTYKALTLLHEPIVCNRIDCTIVPSKPTNTL